MKFRCRCLAHFLKCEKVPPEKRTERVKRRWISGNASQRWGDDIHMPLCPPRQLHLTFFCAPQWDTFFLVMGCPQVWHFWNSSIKQLSFTIVFDWLKSFSVLLLDFDFDVKLNSVSWWKCSLRRSTDATLHKLSPSSSGGGDWDEVLENPEAIWDIRDRCHIWKWVTVWATLLYRVHNTKIHYFWVYVLLLYTEKVFQCHVVHSQELLGKEKVMQYPHQWLEHPRKKPVTTNSDPRLKTLSQWHWLKTRATLRLVKEDSCLITHLF